MHRRLHRVSDLVVSALAVEQIELTVTDLDGQTNTADKFVPITIPRADQLPTIAGPSSKSRKDPFYTGVASSFAGGARAVFCWNPGDWSVLAPSSKNTITEGYVEFRSPRQVNLAPDVCRWLDLLHYRHRRPSPTPDLANAVVTFGHEVAHTVLRAKGVTYTRQEEAFVECVGMQLAPLVSYRLGTSAAYGRAVGRVMWNWYKPSNFVPGYWSSKCRPGGPWHGDGDRPRIGAQSSFPL